ncbi:MAG: RNA polymerase sigma factor [Planctomycetota bacterium]|nr:MAG: RNA polymerase sigma factor [Planctomycetota bacterium]
MTERGGKGALLAARRTVEDCARRCRAGDPEAFGEVYDRLAGDVQRFVVSLRLGLDPAAVEDVVQESFLRLHDRLGALDLERPLRPYLLGVARNAALDALRRREARERREAARAPEDAHPAPDERAARAEHHALVRAALAALRPELRAVLALRHVSGLALSEVALALGCSRPTARARLREAATALHHELRRRGLRAEELDE